eukprot:6464525-Amphidinium_carterae.5
MGCHAFGDRWAHLWSPGSQDRCQLCPPLSLRCQVLNSAACVSSAIRGQHHESRRWCRHAGNSGALVLWSSRLGLLRLLAGARAYCHVYPRYSRGPSSDCTHSGEWWKWPGSPVRAAGGAVVPGPLSIAAHQVSMLKCLPPGLCPARGAAVVAAVGLPVSAVHQAPTVPCLSPLVNSWPALEAMCAVGHALGQEGSAALGGSCAV